jgi:hypothetical protein
MTHVQAPAAGAASARSLDLLINRAATLGRWR